MADFYRVAFSNATETWTLDNQATQLQTIVDLVRTKTGADKVILIGHSMGGLSARQYVELKDQYQSAGKVAALITVGTPHEGTPWAEGLLGAIVELFLCEQAEIFMPQLEPDSRPVDLLNRASPFLPKDVIYESIIGVATGFAGTQALPAGDRVVGKDSQNLQSVLDRYGVTALDHTPRPFPLKLGCDSSIPILTDLQVHTCEPADRDIQSSLIQTIQKVSAGGATARALSLIGQPAPGGGVFAGYVLGDMNNMGDLVFEAGIDLGHTSPGPCNPTTPANCIPADYRMFKLSGGQPSLITVSGIARVGTVRIYDAGDMAFGSVPSGTGPLPSFEATGVYLLKRGTTTPTQIAASGAPTPLGGTYYQINGPLALSEQGDVVFQSSILNPGGMSASCCYNWMYRSATGAVAKLVATGDSTPISGTFAANLHYSIGFTDDGDIVFPAEVTGGTSDVGVFVARRDGRITKVVVRGDPAPAPIGGRLGFPVVVVGRPVAGRRLVFQASISGGVASAAIISKDDVTVESLSDLRFVAIEGRSTRTDVGGTFQSLSNGAGNARVRRDGAVLFDAIVSGASLNGHSLPTDFGIFLWTGREMKRVAVTGEQLATGGTLNVGTSHTLNDVGQVRYLAFSIQ